MNNSYIAGFFDGEGSAMIVTIKRKNNIYRLRPIIAIAQKTEGVLYAIQQHLKIGTVVKGKTCSSYQIAGNKGIISFVDRIKDNCILKHKQLCILKKAALFLTRKKQRNLPYSKKELSYLLDLRDEVFRLNGKTRSNLKQKYPKNVVLKENAFIEDIAAWVIKRSQNGSKAMVAYQQKKKKERITINCACGCGQKLITPDNKCRDRKYIRGHNQIGKNWKWGVHE